MALIQCYECGLEISKSAKACPQCGARPKKKSIGPWVFAGIILLISVHFVSSRSNEVDKSNEDLYVSSGAKASCETSLSDLPLEALAYASYGVRIGLSDEEIWSRGKDYMRAYNSIPEKEYYLNNEILEQKSVLQKIKSIEGAYPSLVLPEDCQKRISQMTEKLSRFGQ